MATCLIAAGSNLGDRAAQLRAAAADVAAHVEIQMEAQSGLHATAPIGGSPGQGEFLNAVWRVRSTLSPEALLNHLLHVEQTLGRTRLERWGPRTVDLDLLTYDELALNEPELELPHPRMTFRRFVMEPAQDVGRDVLHPVCQAEIGRIAEILRTRPPYVALTGGDVRTRHKLAARAADQLSLPLVFRSGSLSGTHDAPHDVADSRRIHAESRTHAAQLLSDLARTSLEGFLSDDWWRELPDLEPRLLVILDAEHAATSEQPHLGSVPQVETIPVWRQLAAKHGGPYLRLRTDQMSSEAMEHELAAAIQAMR